MIISELFTEENSRIAALVHGDPNEVHTGTRFGTIIAPGLMQVQGFIALHGWEAGTCLEVSLEKALAVPNLDAVYGEDYCSYLLEDGKNVYSRATPRHCKFPQRLDSVVGKYGYRLTNDSVDFDWRNYHDIPVSAVRGIIPETNKRSLERAAAVGVSANAFVRTLADNPDFLPDLFFPQARENGRNAVLEEKIVLHMGDGYGNGMGGFQLEVYPVRENPKNKRGLIASVGETCGLFNLEIYFVQVPIKTLGRLIGRG